MSWTSSSVATSIPGSLVDHSGCAVSFVDDVNVHAEPVASTGLTWILSVKQAAGPWHCPSTVPLRASNGLMYVEMEIRSGLEEQEIVLGLSQVKTMPKARLPGEEAGTMGFFPGQKLLYEGDAAEAVAIAPRRARSVGDVAGMLVDPSTQTIHFTLNGELLPKATKWLRMAGLFVVVGWQRLRASSTFRVTAVTGGEIVARSLNAAFAFPLQKYCDSIAKASLESMRDATSSCQPGLLSLVRRHLQARGMVSTLETLDREYQQTGWAVQERRGTDKGTSTSPILTNEKDLLVATTLRAIREALLIYGDVATVHRTVRSSEYLSSVFHLRLDVVFSLVVLRGLERCLDLCVDAVRSALPPAANGDGGSSSTGAVDERRHRACRLLERMTRDVIDATSYLDTSSQCPSNGTSASQAHSPTIVPVPPLEWRRELLTAVSTVVEAACDPFVLGGEEDGLDRSERRAEADRLLQDARVAFRALCWSQFVRAVEDTLMTQRNASADDEVQESGVETLQPRPPQSVRTVRQLWRYAHVASALTPIFSHIASAVGHFVRNPTGQVVQPPVLRDPFLAFRGTVAELPAAPDLVLLRCRLQRTFDLLRGVAVLP